MWQVQGWPPPRQHFGQKSEPETGLLCKASFWTEVPKLDCSGLQLSHCAVVFPSRPTVSKRWRAAHRRGWSLVARLRTLVFGFGVAIPREALSAEEAARFLLAAGPNNYIPISRPALLHSCRRSSFQPGQRLPGSCLCGCDTFSGPGSPHL